MDLTKEVKGLALHSLENLMQKVEQSSERDENYAILRNIQKSAEALMETLLNEGTTEGEP